MLHLAFQLTSARNHWLPRGCLRAFIHIGLNLMSVFGNSYREPVPDGKKLGKLSEQPAIMPPKTLPDHDPS
jgi:hypothetical protein